MKSNSTQDYTTERGIRIIIVGHASHGAMSSCVTAANFNDVICVEATNENMKMSTVTDTLNLQYNINSYLEKDYYSEIDEFKYDEQKEIIQNMRFMSFMHNVKKSAHQPWSKQVFKHKKVFKKKR